MKRIILSFLMVCIVWGLRAQEYTVGTEVQPKNVLLEEFTGVQCGFCPQGHVIAENLKEVLGDRMSVVAIHCGPLAPSNNDIMDFTVPDGKDIGKMLGATSQGFPNGAVNRRGWLGEGLWAYDRSEWEKFTRKILKENAPVNLWSKATFDEETRELKIRVEGYYTEEVTGKNPVLNVFLVQNGISGFQQGQGSSYVHNHVLRDAITDVEGDELAAAKKGDYFVKEYTYQIPESYKKFEAKPYDLELVIFVTQGQKNVLQTITVKPDYVGGESSLLAMIFEPRFAIGEGYRYNFAEVLVKNKCKQTLTSARFEITLNDEVYYSEWKGEIPPFGKKEIRIPVDWNTKAKENNTYWIALRGLNGKKIASNSIRGQFGAPFEIPEKVTFKFGLDEFSSENSIGLYDMDGKCMMDFGPFEDGKAQVHEENLTLQPNTRYCLEIKDIWGNGIKKQEVNALEIYNDQGKLLGGLKTIYGFGCRIFFQTGEPTGIGNAEVEAFPGKMKIYDLSGKLVTVASSLNGLPKGIYIVRTAQAVKKVIVK